MLNLLGHTAEIQRPVVTETSFGTPVNDYFVASTINCLLQVKTLRAVDQFGRMTYQKAPVLYCKDADIMESDRVKHDGKLYRIVGIKDAAGQGHHQEVELESIEDES